MGKGGGFEREISVKLSKWYSGNTRDDIFWRTDSSGGRFTSRKKAGKELENQAGDITYRDVIGKPLIDKYNFEFKTGYSIKSKRKDGSVYQINWCLLDLIDSKQILPMILYFWKQAADTAEQTNKRPILITRRTNKKAIIVITKILFNSIVGYVNNPDFLFIEFPGFGERLICMGLDDFFTWTSGVDVPVLFERI